MRLFNNNSGRLRSARNGAIAGSTFGLPGALVGFGTGYLFGNNKPANKPAAAPKNNKTGTSSYNYQTTPNYGNYGSYGGYGNSGGSQSGLTGNFLFDGYTNPEAFNSIDYGTSYNSAANLYGPYYDELMKYQKDQFQNNLESQKRQFDIYLQGQQASLEKDRSTLDQNAGQNNYAFSEGLRNKQRATLQEAYNRDINAKREALANGIQQQARDLEYQLGSKALNNMNFNLSTGTADALSNTPALVRGNNRVYRTRGYKGQIPQAKQNTINAAAAGNYGYQYGSSQPGFSSYQY